MGSKEFFYFVECSKSCSYSFYHLITPKKLSYGTMVQPPLKILIQYSQNSRFPTWEIHGSPRACLSNNKSAWKNCIRRNTHHPKDILHTLNVLNIIVSIPFLWNLNRYSAKITAKDSTSHHHEWNAYRGHGAAERRSISLFTLKKKGNSPNKTMLSQEHINTPKQNILIQLVFFCSQQDKWTKRAIPLPHQTQCFCFWAKIEEV